MRRADHSYRGFLLIVVCLSVALNPIQCGCPGLLSAVTLHVSDSSPLHHKEFFIVRQKWYMSYRFADSLRAGSGRRNFPKYVEFYSKNKFERLVQLVG